MCRETVGANSGPNKLEPTTLLVLTSKKTKELGIGSNTNRALTISLGVPLILTLSLQRVLEGQTVAAIVGLLLGLGAQRDKQG